MSGVIDVISRPVGESDISFGQNSFVYVDINGVTRRVNQINAKSVPWYTIPTQNVDNIVDGSKAVPVGASSLAVAGTSIFSGPIIGTGATSGFIKNYASGLFQYGQSLAVADIPSGIPASSIGAGIVNNTEFGYVDGLTSTAQAQIDGINSSLVGVQRFQYYQPPQAPKLVFSTTNVVLINANTICPALVVMNGFPDILNPGQFVTAGLTDSSFYAVTTATSYTMSANTYGAEKASQWYGIYALAAVTDYTLKGMPYMRVKGEASQVISTGTLITPATVIDYAFTANEFVDGYIYVLSGTKQGEARLITANGDAAGSSTFTYSGADLSLTAGDWFIVLPNANFRLVGDVFNNSSSNIDSFIQDGRQVSWSAPRTITAPSAGPTEDITCAPPTAIAIGVQGNIGTTIGHPDGTNYIQMGASEATVPTLHYSMVTPSYDPPYYWLGADAGATQHIDANATSYKTFAESPIKNCKYKGAGAAIIAIYFKYPPSYGY